MNAWATMIGQLEPLPLDARWVAIVVIASLVAIVAAACIGPIVRRRLPPQSFVPSDDEPSGADQLDDRGLEIRALRKRRRR
jgi:hypothetical protein